MAKSTRTGASYLAESRNTKKKNPFAGKTLAEMKKMYSDMTPAQRKANVETFRAAAKTARKPVAKGGNKPKPKQTTKQEATSRFYSSSSGTRGQSRPSNSPGPAVVKPGSRTGASVDPRERQLRKNREEARSSGGSSSAGRANIRRMVAEQSGSGRRNQRQVEERRRRARQRGAARNRRQYLASKYNDM
jgi:hypothetical protein